MEKDKHEHTHNKRIAIPIVPTSSKAKAEIDDIRRSKHLEPFDFQQKRYILARQCACSDIEAYDLVDELPTKKTEKEVTT